jgi:hypothetical protein
MTYTAMNCAALEADADAILEANPLPGDSGDTLPDEPFSEDEKDEAALLAYELNRRQIVDADEGLYPQEQCIYADQLRDLETRRDDAIAFHNDGRPRETAAEARMRQRRDAEQKRTLVNFVQIAANVETTPDKVLSVLSGLPLEVQHRVALLAQRHADLKAIRKIQSGSAREKRLSQGVADILQAIGRDTPQTRRRIAEMKSEVQADALADMVAKWRAEAQRIRATDWEKQRRFEQAQAIQRTNDIEEIVKRFRALPDDPKQAVLANLICESEEAL